MVRAGGFSCTPPRSQRPSPYQNMHRLSNSERQVGGAARAVNFTSVHQSDVVGSRWYKFAQQKLQQMGVTEHDMQTFLDAGDVQQELMLQKTVDKEMKHFLRMLAKHQVSRKLF